MRQNTISGGLLKSDIGVAIPRWICTAGQSLLPNAAKQ